MAEIPKCTCKEVAELDEIALREGRKPSLSEKSPCFSCSGERLHCHHYSNQNVDKEKRRRLIYETTFGQGRFILGNKN